MLKLKQVGKKLEEDWSSVVFAFILINFLVSSVNKNQHGLDNLSSTFIQLFLLWVYHYLSVYLLVFNIEESESLKTVDEERVNIETADARDNDENSSPKCYRRHISIAYSIYGHHDKPYRLINAIYFWYALRSLLADQNAKTENWDYEDVANQNEEKGSSLYVGLYHKLKIGLDSSVFTDSRSISIWKSWQQ